MTWRDYVRTLLLTTLLGAGGLYAWILLVDPYNNVWFSPPVEREPLSKNQRFSYPGLARNPRFDSVLIGTSSARLLRPSQLGPPLGASFVNLAMNAATPYEQAQILSVFLRHRTSVKYAVFGVDEIWCEPDRDLDKFSRYRFPHWMYDEDVWNDLPHLFNTEALSQAWSQFRNFMGWRTPRWGMDGYRNFLPPASTYDVDEVRLELYKGLDSSQDSAARPTAEDWAAERMRWTFPELMRLREMLAAPPQDTVKVLFLPPYHHTHLPRPASRGEATLEECKTRILDMAQSMPNVTVLDFMFRSRITLADENYWDRVHYRLSVAEEIGGALLNALQKNPEASDIYRIRWSQR